MKKKYNRVHTEKVTRKLVLEIDKAQYPIAAMVSEHPFDKGNYTLSLRNRKASEVVMIHTNKRVAVNTALRAVKAAMELLNAPKFGLFKPGELPAKPESVTPSQPVEDDDNRKPVETRKYLRELLTMQAHEGDVQQCGRRIGLYARLLQKAKERGHIANDGSEATNAETWIARVQYACVLRNEGLF